MPENDDRAAPASDRYGGWVDGWVPWGARLAALAPGMLRSRLVVLGALVVTPWLTPLIFVEDIVRVAAGLLLVGHIVGAVYVRHARDVVLARWVAVGELAIDAVGCGLLAGAGGWRGAGVPLAAVVLVIAFDTGGVRAVLTTALVIILVGAVTYTRGVGTPLILSPTVAFPTSLRVDASFGGRATFVGGAPRPAMLLDSDGSYAGRIVVDPQALSFPTALRVDTVFLGVSALGASSNVLVPAMGLALLAICVGSGASLVAPSQEPNPRLPRSGQ